MNQSHFFLLRQAILAAIADVERHAPLLDRINVFPVVDADTGTNLSQTLGALKSALLEQETSRITIEKSIDAVFRGARGNSGVILAEFTVAFLETVLVSQHLTQNLVVQAIGLGASRAFGAVAKPVRGTILTVMEDVAEALAKGEPIDNLASHGAFEKMSSEAVARTQTQLPKLAKAGVVDSGALGFHLFISGLTLILPALAGDDRVKNKMVARIQGADTAPLGAGAKSILPGFLEKAGRHKPDFRFCMSILLEPGEEPEPPSPREMLRDIASSIDVAGSGKLLKLHVHSNRPEEVKKRLETIGAILDVHTDDMTAGLIRAQSLSEIPRADRKNTRVVSDSSMSLNHELAGSLGVFRMENYIHAHSSMLRDADLDREELYRRMRSGSRFKTAQTSPEDVKSFFQNALKFSDGILYVAVGNAYTGTQEMVRRVARELPERNRICIVDTHAASGQQGLVCLTTARYASKASTLRELTQYAEHQVATCREYLVIDNLKYLRRSGRIGRIKATFADMLSLKPIVGHGLDGAVTYAKVRSHDAAAQNILERLANHPGEGPLVVMAEYTDNLDWLMANVVQKIEMNLEEKPEVVLSPLSSTSAVHMGPGTWGIAVTRK